MRARRTALVAVLAALVTGCGTAEETNRGGAIIGETLTIYSVLPDDPARADTAQDLIDGEKLAIAQAGGRSGAYLVNFSTLRFGDEPGAVAETVRTAMRDPAVIAVIGDLDSLSARVSIPLLNAAGVLHLSPGATYTGFLAPAPGAGQYEPARWNPSGRPTFAPLAPADVVQARALAAAARGGRVAVEAEGSEASVALGEAVAGELGERLAEDDAAPTTLIYVGEDVDAALGVIESLRREAPRSRILLPEALLRTDLAERLPRADRARVRFLASVGPVEADVAFTTAFREAFRRDPGPYAKVGYDATRAVLAAIERAGEDAGRRSSVIAQYLSAKPVSRLAAAPWYEVRVSASGALAFEVLRR